MRVAKRTFSGGEIDPDLWHNSDLVPVRNGAAEICNFIVRGAGGVERRPGTEFIARSRDGGLSRVRLARWVADVSAAYVAEWGDGYVRMREGQTAPQGDFQTVDTPFDRADVKRLQWAQSSDVQWVFSGRRIRELVREETEFDGAFPGIVFRLLDSKIEDGPFLDRNADPARTIRASGITGSVTLTGTGEPFRFGHPGAVFKLSEGDLAAIGNWQGGIEVAVGDRVRSAGAVYVATTGGTTSGLPPSHLDGEARDAPGGVVWKYLHEGFGTVRIDAVAGRNQATATVLTRLPESVRDAATDRWSEGAWSQANGYPATGALYKSALWAGGTKRQPSTIWKSAIEGFDTFGQGTDEDDPLSRGLYGSSADSVRWMAPGRVLTIGTSGPEWIARPEVSGDTVRVGGLITEEATNQGACDIPGITVAGRTMFPARDRRSLRAMRFDFREDAWSPETLSLLAGHITGRGIAEMAFQRVPWTVLWLLLDDGTLGALTYVPEQNVVAWHRHDFGGSVESIAVVPRGDGEDEALWLAIRRNINGFVRVHLERMCSRFRPEAGDGIETACQLDSARLYDGPATSIVTGLDHLEGETVAALVDGNAHPDMVVANGQVTLNFPGSRIVVGRRYESRLRTLPFDLGIQEEFQTGRAMRVTDIGIGFRASLGGTVEIGRRREDVFRLGDTALDRAPALYDGIRKVDPPASEDGGQLAYVNDTPWPATVTGIFPEYEV